MQHELKKKGLRICFNIWGSGDQKVYFMSLWKGQKNYGNNNSEADKETKSVNNEPWMSPLHQIVISNIDKNPKNGDEIYLIETNKTEYEKVIKV